MSGAAAVTALESRWFDITHAMDAVEMFFAQT
jgi:hypothetical protein